MLPELKMYRLLRLMCTLALLLAPAAAFAEGALYLQEFNPRFPPGASNAQLFVYSEDGSLIHSGQGNGGYDAGVAAELSEGWYWVEVGLHRTVHNLQRVYVSEGETTVVPSGWVAVYTDSLDEQPPGCNQWLAELIAFKVAPDGTEHLVMDNRDAAPEEFGAIQLPAGDFRVYFNGFPVDVTVQADQVFILPTGYQAPVAGGRPQLALREEGAADNIVVPLCPSGAIHVPAGEYYVSRLVPTDMYPYERRVWDRVTIPDEAESRYRDVRSERVRDRFDGNGSVPVDIDPEADSEVVVNYLRGTTTGSSDSGMGALPNLDDF